MVFERVVTVGRHQYRQLVESYWDPRLKQTRKRILRHLGPVSPSFPRPGAEGQPATLPLSPVHFGLLATRMMSGTLTAAHVMQTIQDMGQGVPPGDLSAAGIRFDLGGKNLSLLLWLAPTSSDRPPAPPARLRGRSKDAGRPPRSSPSRAAAR